MTTERSHDLKFNKGTIYIVYFHTHVHVHIEKMGNLSKSKLKLYICDNKLRSCAQFAPRCKCAPGWLICSTEFAPPTKVEQIRIFIKHHLYDQNTPQVQIYTRVYICTGVYIVHVKRGLKQLRTPLKKIYFDKFYMFLLHF